jgi:predicted ArsR family transcriptional regulator
MAATRTKQRLQQGLQKSVLRDIRAPEPPTPPPTDVKGFIVGLLRNQGPLTRGDITTRSRIPRTTVYDTLVNLVLSGVVDKYVERNGRRGRPSVFYQLAAQ